MTDMELQEVEMKKERKELPISQPDCHCNSKPRPCYECEYTYYRRRKAPRLSTDCIVVDSLVCSQTVPLVAEYYTPLTVLGDLVTIGPGGIISPIVTLTPDVDNIVYKITVFKNLIVLTGYLPANITIFGIELPISISIRFQKEINCPGVCPQDDVTVSPFKLKGTVAQGIEPYGVVVGGIMFKAILSTKVTATRPVIVKERNLRVVSDVNEDRCEMSDDND